MGMFDKLFGKNQKAQSTEQPKSQQQIFQIEKTAETLNEDLFWKIIDKSLQETNNQDSQEQYLIKEIGKLTPKELIGFRLQTDKLLYETYNSEMWCAGYIMNGGCSDDSFEYFRNWVISRGRDTYYKAKENPDYLINEVVDGAEFYDFESFWYVALEAFQQKTGKDLYDYIDYDNFRLREGNYPQIEFTWEDDKPESMKKICPRLFEKMWN
ncbi:uncharacterized protein DUF4240 [Mangrovibacterium diazotrophicum]|uniref:Uncharacterized protein DUF4240 n=2 Tax=Mangrovibacterium diazotrophicum TaxID=1261403 RepID=A0A419VX71_9BACT|nr:uncharacterized protein DUF4240 [Mangrovibacterium diazotrophicum]